jgi:endonuclease-8
VPEGDTIHRTADRLRPTLVGRPVVEVRARRVVGAVPRPGTVLTAVEAVGKHLLIRFADGHVLRTHLGMTGRWDLYGPGERWRRPAHLARAVVAVEGAVAVCFAAPVAELTRGAAPDGRVAPDRPVSGSDFDGESKPGDGEDGRPGSWAGGVAAVAHLGPDLCRPDTDLDAVVARMAAVPGPGTVVADVLLDQRVAAGIGNVYKSEVLWACRLHPLTPIEAVDGATRRSLVETAAAQLRRNLGGGPRTTVAGPPGSMAVYGRARRPCRRCGTAIRWARTGRTARGTYWCPRCQPAPGGE